MQQEKAPKGKEGKKDKAGAQTGLNGGGKEAKTPKEKGAPRARKWEYGITDEARIVRLAEVASVKRDIQVQFGYTEGDPTVADFKKKGGNRHGLRVMMRRKLIKLVHADGKEFPVAYVKPEKPAKEEKQEKAAA